MFTIRDLAKIEYKIIQEKPVKTNELINLYNDLNDLDNNSKIRKNSKKKIQSIINNSLIKVEIDSNSSSKNDMIKDIEKYYKYLNITVRKYKEDSTCIIFNDNNYLKVQKNQIRIDFDFDVKGFYNVSESYHCYIDISDIQEIKEEIKEEKAIINQVEIKEENQEKSINQLSISDGILKEIDLLNKLSMLEIYKDSDIKKDYQIINKQDNFILIYSTNKNINIDLNNKKAFYVGTISINDILNCLDLLINLEIKE